MIIVITLQCMAQVEVRDLGMNEWIVETCRETIM